MVMVEEFQNRLETALRTRAPQLELRRILGLARFPGGLSSESWRLDVETETGTAAWVLRMEPAVGIIEPYDLVKEHEVMSALYEVGLPVPRPLHIEASRDVLGARFMVMSFVEGEIYQANDPRLEDEGLLATVQEGYIEALAALHTAPPPPGWAPPPGGSFAAAEVQACRRRLEQVELLPLPGIRHAIATLERRAPTTEHVVILHGDYRLPNLKWADGAISGILDWERARLGDPLADIAFTQTIGAGACTITGEVAERYTSLTGIEIDESRLAYFRLLEVVRAMIIGASAPWAISRGSTDLRLLSVGAGIMGGEAMCPMLEAQLDATAGGAA